MEKLNEYKDKVVEFVKANKIVVVAVVLIVIILLYIWYTSTGQNYQDEVQKYIDYIHERQGLKQPK